MEMFESKGVCTFNFDRSGWAVCQDSVVPPKLTRVSLPPHLPAPEHYWCV